jgi:hypothetical protein
MNEGADGGLSAHSAHSAHHLPTLFLRASLGIFLGKCAHYAHYAHRGSSQEGRECTPPP